MSAPAPKLATASALICAGLACARPTEVELRLYPCTSITPVRVTLDVQGYDADGGALEPLYADFEIGGAAVFADGFATVGLRKPDALAEADFTLTWHDAQGAAEVVTHPRLAVPEVGAVLELGAEMCVPVDDTSSSGDASSGSSSTGDGTTVDASSTGETTASSSTGSSTDDTTTGDSSTSTGDTDTTGETTGEPSKVGEPCGGEVMLFCENVGPGKPGTALACINKVWQLADLDMDCKPLSDYCPTGKMMNPKPVGCTAYDDGIDGFSCVCEEEPVVPCVPDDIGCVGIKEITMCVDDGMGGAQQLKGLCVGQCYDDAKAPYCVPD